MLNLYFHLPLTKPTYSSSNNPIIIKASESRIFFSIDDSMYSPERTIFYSKESVEQTFFSPFHEQTFFPTNS